MKDKLPEKFVVRTDTANELWSKYEKWLSETAEKRLVFKYRDYKYYGIEFGNGGDSIIAFDTESDIAEYGATILTLDQWHKLAYPEYEVSYVAEKPSDNDAEQLLLKQTRLEKEISELNAVLQRMFMAVLNSQENKALAEAHVELNRINKLLNPTNHD